MGSVPPVDSITISDQNTPVEMCTEAIFDIAMLSSLLPNQRDLTRLTRCGLMTSFVGNKKLPCVQRLAAKVSAGEESIGLVGTGVMSSAAVSAAVAGASRPRMLHPFQRALFPHPDVYYDQDDEKDQHLDQPEQPEGLELHRPRKQKNRLHIEHNEQNRNDVIANRVASSRVVDGVDPALVRHQLGLAGILRPHQFGQQQRDRQ